MICNKTSKLCFSRQHEFSSHDCSTKSTRNPKEPHHCIFPFVAIMLTIKQALTVVSERPKRERAKLPLRIKLEYETRIERSNKELL